MLPTSQLDYNLPPELIATRPAEPRDASRMLVVSRSDPRVCEHRRFGDLTDFLRPDDLLVFNRSSVIPARLQARRQDTGGAVSGLYLECRPDGSWLVMLHAGGRLSEGLVLSLLTPSGELTPFSLKLLSRDRERWVATPSEAGTAGRPGDALELLRQVGGTPLPPYILKSRRASQSELPDELDQRWYQTVYADPNAQRSVAAPTAGLHFTPELLARARAMGVRTADLHLHVGAGTFKPIESELVEEHPIHEEWIDIPVATVEHLAAARSGHGRVLCVGTTSVRAVESLPHPLDDPAAERGFAGPTRLLITPGFRFRWTDALITNFHLPRSTLLALVAALFPEGVDRIREIYRLAIEHRYRFYSYGDAMLVLP